MIILDQKTDIMAANETKTESSDSQRRVGAQRQTQRLSQITTAEHYSALLLTTAHHYCSTLLSLSTLSARSQTHRRIQWTTL